MITFKVYSLSNFQVSSTAWLTTVTMLYIKSPELTLNWKLVPFAHLHPFPPQSIPLYSLFLRVCFCSVLSNFWPYQEEGGTLGPWPEIKSTSQALEGKVLTTGLPGKSQVWWYSFYSSHISGIIQSLSFSYFTKHNGLKVNPCCHKGWISFLLMDE